MKTATKREIGRWTAALQNGVMAAQRFALTTLCGLLLVSSALAQEQQPEERRAPEPPTPAASPAEKPPDPNETLTPAPLANQTVDGDIVFTSPGQFTYPRDIRLSDSFGGLRFYGANQLTTQPAGAAIQFFGNQASPFNGQLYLDSGAHNLAALIFRTVPLGGSITERMRITSAGNVGIGTASPVGRLHVVGSSNTAVQAETNGQFAVSAIATGINSRGVFGRGELTGVEGNSATGAGVYGLSNSGSGVIGESNTSHGVYGDSNTGVGVYGESTDGTAVLGVNTNGTGVRGESTNGTGLAGISVNGLAGRFFGNVQVTGNLSKGSGSFKIDHPLDPENKYLSHSFVESPDMMNIYNGNVTLDRRGGATITLPAYFAALNREFRYQLTAVGAPGPNLYIAEKIKGNQFKIAGGRRGTEVSWQVTGVRQDAYAEKHRIQVEEEKTGEERGTYLNPEAFGQPKEKGIAHVRRPSLEQQPKEETGRETAAKRTTSGQR